MKRSLMIVLGTLLFMALLVVPSTPASAANTTCTSSPSSGHVGTTFTVSCVGFIPGETVFSWLTEPDGHALSWVGAKVGSGGTVSISVPTGFGTFNLALGQWAVTVKGAAATGIGYFWLNGGTEGVSGASLSVSSSGFVTGSGFAPGEVVSIWVDFPHGDCSGTWSPFTFFGPIGFSNAFFGNVTASSSGTIGFQFFILNSMCDGTYHIVARGNSSGLGADTWWTTPPNPTSAGATLVANPSSVLAYGGSISFSGSGFAPNSGATCWETSPQGQVLFIGSVTTDSGGHLGIGFTTGLNFFGLFQSSEGALGQWALTCRDGAGNTGIATFNVVGGVVDP